MKKHILVFAFLILVNTVFLVAQDTVDSNNPTVFERWPSSLGFYVHTLNGPGLSWQHWFDRFGLSIAAGGLYDPTSGSYNSIIDYNIQGTFSYAVYREDFADWFSGNLQLGVYLAHRGLQEWQYPEYPIVDPLDAPLPDPVKKPFVPSVHLGLGVIIEIVLFNHFSFVTDLMYVGSIPLGLNLNPGFSFRYRY